MAPAEDEKDLTFHAVDSDLRETETESETLISHEDHSSRRTKARTSQQLSCFLLGSWALVASITALIFLLYKLQHGQPTWVDCGSTVAEARARNCHYEPMLRSWIPDACYFTEPSHEYDPFGDREWFADANLTQPADLEKLRAGDDYVGYTRHFHMEHCLYAWRKLAIAVEQRKPFLDSKSYSLGHATHCAKQIAGELVAVAKKTWDPDGIQTETPIMFQTCVRLPWAA